VGLLGALMTLAPASWAHRRPDAPVPSLAVLTVDAPLTVDGVLDEPFWAECAVGTGLIDIRTQQPAAEQTTIRIACTREHLYVGVECFDRDMSQIRATEQREDRVFQGDDWVEVHFDPPHRHRGKYAFFTNPLGTKADANEGPSGQFNYGWSADWDCAARIDADRWTFEMRIPLKVMNYFRTDGQRWGFNLTRLQRRTDVTSFWSFSATDMYKPRHFGHLTGLDLAGTVFDRNWEFTPYVSTRTDFNGDVDTFFSAGIDIGARLTPSISAAVTINPDFGQVEADDDTIELRDTERFLPEKRLFFREGDELIRPPHLVYYSRRFTDIEAGLKSTGSGRGFSFLFQNLQSEIAHDGDYYGNSSMLYVSQDLGERSYLGWYGAYSQLHEGYAGAGSLDGYLFLNDAWRIRFQAALAEEWLEGPQEVELKDSTDFLGLASLIYSRYPWELQLSYTAITDDFNPMLGYIPRRDIFGPSFQGTYHVKAGEGWYKELTFAYSPKVYFNEDGDNTLRDHELYASGILRNDLGLRAGYLDEYHRPYHNYRLSGGVDVFASDYFKSINLAVAGGEFQETRYQEGSLGKRIKFWDRLPIKEELVMRWEQRPGGDQELVWLNRVVFDLFLRSNMWLKGSLQIRNDDLHNYSIIYGWEFHRRAWFYLVYNEVEDDTPDAGRSVFAKITYSF